MLTKDAGPGSPVCVFFFVFLLTFNFWALSPLRVRRGELRVLASILGGGDGSSDGSSYGNRRSGSFVSARNKLGSLTCSVRLFPSTSRPAKMEGC